MLDLEANGSFAIGDYHSGHPEFGWNEAGLTDGDTTTYGLLQGHAPYPDYNLDHYTVVYTFNAPQYIDTLQFYLTQCDLNTVSTRIFTTTGYIDKHEANLLDLDNWLVYDDIQAIVTHIHFLAPEENRYTITEIEMYDEPIYTGPAVPEPLSILGLSLSLIGYAIKRKCK